MTTSKLWGGAVSDTGYNTIKKNGILEEQEKFSKEDLVEEKEMV